MSLSILRPAWPQSRHLLFILLFATAKLGHATANQLRSDELRQLQLMKDPNVVVIDVRPAKDFAQGHVQGARNMMTETLADAHLPKDAHIVVYCGEDTCALSAAAADKLAALGYLNVSYLKDGFNGWLRRHYPAQAGAALPQSNLIRSIGAEEARRLIDAKRLMVLDVRPGLEFQAGHLPSAHSIPLENMESEIQVIPKDSLILVIDRIAQRSRQAAERLTAAGFNVAELAGGISGWTKKGFPLAVK